MTAPWTSSYVPNEDPIAALIGKGLAAFGAVRTARQQEADRQQRRADEQQKESDAADWRKFQITQAGYTNTPQTTPGAPLPMSDSAKQLGLRGFTAPDTPTAPAFHLEGADWWKAGPSATEQRQIDKETHDDSVARAAGHAYARTILKQDVDDDTALGMGRNLTPWTSLQRTTEPNYLPVKGPSGDVLAFDRRTGRATESGGNVGQSQAFGGMAGVTGREAVAAAKAAQDAALEMVNLYNADHEAPVRGLGSVVASGLGHLAGKFGGHDVNTAISMQGLTPHQQQFQKAADRMLHNISALLPKGGRSVAILDNLRQSFTLSPGQTDAATVQRTVDAAQQVAELYARALRGEKIDLQSELERVGSGTRPPRPAGGAQGGNWHDYLHPRQP